MSQLKNEPRLPLEQGLRAIVQIYGLRFLVFLGTYFVLFVLFSFWFSIDPGIEFSPQPEPMADLSRVSLRESDLGGADLSGADLSEADLISADLNGANLSGADLKRAFLMEANLGGADLSGADLRGASLISANLNGADLSNALIDEFTTLPDGNRFQENHSDLERFTNPDHPNFWLAPPFP